MITDGFPRLVLGIDTASDVRVGLAAEGRVLGRAVFADRRAHVEQLLCLVQQVLQEAEASAGDLSGIIVGVGPGPFTGLRVGVVAALSLAEAIGVQARGVCSLDVIAAEWARSEAPQSGFAVVTDARRREVYWARYGADGGRLLGPRVTSPDEVPDVPLAGPGVVLTGRQASGPADLDPGLLASLGHLLPDAGLEPLYLRRPDAETPTKPKSTLPRPRLTMIEGK